MPSCINAMHPVFVSLPSDLAVLTRGSQIRKRYERSGDPDSFKVTFNASLMGATMRVIKLTRRLGRLTEMDGNCFEISANKRCWSLPNSSNKSIRSPYVGSAPVG